MMDVMECMHWLVYLGALSLLFFVAKRLLYNQSNSNKKFAPSVGCLPIIGSIPYLPALPDVHTWSLKKSSELGPIFSITVGKMYIVVMNNVELIREALVQQSSDYADRMVHFGNRVLNPNAKGIIFHQYNDEFKKYRQLTLSILRDFGFGQNSMETRICMEIDQVIKKIIAYNGEPFYPKEMLDCGAFNVLSRMVFGKPLDESSERDKTFLKLIGTFTNHINALLPMDIIPSLQYIPYFRKKINEARVHTKELMHVFDLKIAESLSDASNECFVNRFAEREDGNPDMEQLRYIVRDVIFAGADTMSATTQWILLLLANYPDVQRRLQTEIDSVVPSDRLPSISDMKSLTYVEAVILEMMRYKTVTPLGLAHKTLRDTEVGGYSIPKDSIVWTMFYAVNMNKETWTHPNVFRPERFLDADGNIINRDLVIPFSLGKRSCIGELMARQQLFLYFTSFLQKFNILPPDGEKQISEDDHRDMILAPCPFKVRCLLRKTT